MISSLHDQCSNPLSHQGSPVGREQIHKGNANTTNPDKLTHVHVRVSNKPDLELKGTLISVVHHDPDLAELLLRYSQYDHPQQLHGLEAPVSPGNHTQSLRYLQMNTAGEEAGLAHYCTCETMMHVHVHNVYTVHLYTYMYIRILYRGEGRRRYSPLNY